MCSSDLSAVYEFITSRKLAAEARDGRLVTEVDLPAAGGRVLCVYPRPLKKLRLAPDKNYSCGTAGTVAVTLLDAGGTPAPGRQMAQVTILDPAGATHDESGFYRMENGTVRIPFRPALNDPPGKWRIRVTERTSGLTADAKLSVAAPR